MTNTEIANASKIMLGSTEALIMYIGNNLVWLKTLLPYDSKIEYLQSTGTQYIDTLFEQKDIEKFAIKYYSDNFDQPGYGNAMGCRWTSNNREFQVTNYSSSISIGVRNSNMGNDAHQINEIIYNGGNTINVNGTIKNIYNITTLTDIYHVILFGIWDEIKGGVTQLENTKIYYVTLEGNGKKLELIPVRKNGIGYMYDKVSGLLFGNSGTGSFTLGPDIVEIEYLENSSNYQYIDTGISTKNSNVGIDCSINLGSYSHDKWGLGYNYYNNKDSSGLQIGCYNNNLVVGLYSSDDVIYTKIVGNPTYTDNTNYHIIINCLNIPISINGVTYGDSQLNNLGSFGGNIYLFRRNGNLNALQGAKLNTKIFYCKVYTNNNTLVRDFIPVRIGQVGYMYDKISNKLYGSSSGDFILGPDKT